MSGANVPQPPARLRSRSDRDRDESERAVQSREGRGRCAQSGDEPSAAPQSPQTRGGRQQKQGLGIESGKEEGCGKEKNRFGCAVGIATGIPKAREISDQEERTQNTEQGQRDPGPE